MPGRADGGEVVILLRIGGHLEGIILRPDRAGIIAIGELAGLVIGDAVGGDVADTVAYFDLYLARGRGVIRIDIISGMGNGQRRQRQC